MPEDVPPIRNERPLRRNGEEMRGLYILDVIALVLLVIGGLNWLLVGAFNWNLVHAMLGWAPLVERLAYVIVGISAIYVAVITPMLVSQWRHPATSHPSVGF